MASRRNNSESREPGRVLDRRQTLSTIGLTALAASLTGSANATPTSDNLRFTGFFLTGDRRLSKETVESIKSIEVAKRTEKTGDIAALSEKLKQTSDPLAASLAFAYVADAQLDRGEPANALKSLREASTLAEKNQQPLVKHYVDCRIVWLRNAIEKNKAASAPLKAEALADAEAIKQLNSILAESEKQKSPFLAGFAHHMLGVVYQRKGDMADSLQHLEAALKIRKQIRHYNQKMTLLAIADHYALLGQSEKAMQAITSAETQSKIDGRDFSLTSAASHRPLVATSSMVNVLEQFSKSTTSPSVKESVMATYNEGFKFTKPSILDLYHSTAMVMD